jgi:hypothetical protein
MRYRTTAEDAFTVNKETPNMIASPRRSSRSRPLFYSRWLPLQALLCLGLAALAACLATTPAAATIVAAPAWAPVAVSGPTNLPPGGVGKIAVYVQNIGGATSSGTILLEDHLPAGITTTGTPTGSGGGQWSCLPAGAGQSTITCMSSHPVGPSLTAEAVVIPVAVGIGALETEPNLVNVSGGGAADPASYEERVTISSTPAKPGASVFSAASYDADGAANAQAGSHPYIGTSAVFANTVRTAKGQLVPAGDPRTIAVDLPPGFLGNPVATPRCKEGSEDLDCPLDTQVGVAAPVITNFGANATPVAVHNVAAPIGYPAKFTFSVSGVEQINVVARVRSDEDYGVTAESPNTPQIAPVYGAFFTLWGAPADLSHDGQRCTAISNSSGCAASDAENTAFITQPSDCSLQADRAPFAQLNFDTWLTQGEFEHQKFGVPPVTGCEQLKFEADFTFEPSSTASDSPVAFQTRLSVPSEGLTSPEKLATPPIKRTVVKLPQGVVLNASAADGLGACSEEQIGLLNEKLPSGQIKPEPLPNRIRFSKAPNQCSDASKIGTGEVKSALLDNPLNGALYLAAQGNGNPFGSLFALYLVIEDPSVGIFIKLPGEVAVDERTGQMTVSFEDLPQLPFTTLKLNLKGGNRSPLASPSTCGNYVTTAVNTPWSAPESGPPTESSNGFEINQGPNGLPCAKTPAERPFDIGWKAGAEGTQAGASSPFSFRITRADGSQEIDTLDLATPPGLSASLKGVPYCSEAQIKTAEGSTGKAEQANPACPSASQVGRLEVGTGSGLTPFYTGGKLYLAGPYKGAPISVVSVVPAVAGPFDLGNVVSRNALLINRQTAQVTAKSDPIPQILKGVVLRIRDIRIFLNHKDWTLNPTSCEPSSVNLTIHGNSGATAERSTRFQIGGCDKLAFAPKLTAKVTGGTKRGDHPAFTAELNYPPGGGYANIKDVQVALPHSEFLDQAHINTICTRVQAAAGACPQGSIYGYAEAETPLLDGKLTGPVFLKSSDHQLPDLAIALKGPENQPIEVEFAGRIDSIHAQIRNTIEGLPDVPVTKFVLKMRGGKKGLLINSRNLCSGKPGRMTVNMTAQNNRRSDSSPKLGNSCGSKKHNKSKKHQHRRLAALVGDF